MKEEVRKQTKRRWRKGLALDWKNIETESVVADHHDDIGIVAVQLVGNNLNSFVVYYVDGNYMLTWFYVCIYMQDHDHIYHLNSHGKNTLQQQRRRTCHRDQKNDAEITLV